MTTRVFLSRFDSRVLARASTLALAIASAFPRAAVAQTSPSTLTETVVTATRVEQPLTDIIGDISIVDRDTIERSGATGVADLLARLPGIEIARNGSIGSTTSLFIRGAESRFTAVYLDGVRIDSQATGGATWESIPLAQIDRIEVLRGPAAAVYGSDAIGGVVQLFTKKGEGPATPFVGIGFGSRGLRRSEAGIGGSAGAFDYSLGAAYEESRGFNARPVSGANPDKDGYVSHSANAKLGYKINDRHRLEATVLESKVKSRYDDFFYDPTFPADDLNRYRLSTAGLAWTAQWTDVYRTRLSVTDSTSHYDTRPSPYITETKLRSYLFQNDFRFGAHLVTASLERREDKLFNPALDAFSTTIDRKRSQDGVALGYSYSAGPHTVQLNVRHDRDSEFGGKTNGSAAYGFAITPQWRFTASAASAFRAPTLYQRFSEYGVSTLRPETSRNLELGMKYNDGTTTAGLVVYRNRVRDLISFDFNATNCASFFGCYANTARAEYVGATLSASHRLGDLTLRGSIDLQDPRDLDTDKQLTLRARKHASFGADWRVGLWTLGAEWQVSGRRFANAANTQVLPGYGVVNLVATTPIAKDFTLIARVDNVGDRDYQLVRGYATPGRSVYVGVKWQPR